MYVVMHLLKWLQVHNGKYGFGVYKDRMIGTTGLTGTS